MIIPVLHTQRLVLRPVKQSDAAALYVLRSDPEQMKYIPRPLMQSIADAEKMLDDIVKGAETNTLLNWTITLKDDDACLGVFGFYRMFPEHFRAELGYMLHPSYQGKGLMKEALQSIIQFGFSELNLHTIEAVIDPENIASEKLLQSLGFKKEAHFKENICFEGRFMDSVHYTLFGR